MDKSMKKNFLIKCLKMHCFLYVILMVMINGTSVKALELIRNGVEYKIYKKLSKKYKKVITNQMDIIKQASLNRKKRDTIWICWLQGFQTAPEIVKKCCNSIKNNIKNKEIILLDETNIFDYVKLPDYIIDKYKQGLIKTAHFSDLLRLELLTTYGGTWIDSTVFSSNPNTPDFYFDSKLFVFQMLKPGLNGQTLTMSNWFISAYSNSPILLMTKFLLLEYWKKKNKAFDYYIFHYFFEIAKNLYPDEWNSVVPISPECAHNLQLNFYKPYREKIYNGIIKISDFHKLTYRLNDYEEGSILDFFLKNK